MCTVSGSVERIERCIGTGSVHTADSFAVFSVNKSTAFTGPLDANRPAAEN